MGDQVLHAEDTTWEGARDGTSDGIKEGQGGQVTGPWKREGEGWRKRGNRRDRWRSGTGWRRVEKDG